MKITITGTQGTGKSHLCAALKTTIEAQNKSVHLIPEVTKNCPYPLNENATSATQDWLWHEQMRLELVAQNSGAGVIICDRSIMDHLCYLLRIVNKKHNLYQKHLEDEFGMLYGISKEWMSSYDYIVRLPLDLDRLQSGNNSLRSEDVAFAKEIDLLFDDLMSPYVNSTVDELFATVKNLVA